MIKTVENYKTENYQKGLALLKQLHGGQAGEQLVNNLKDICPDVVDMTIEWAMQGIMARPFRFAL
jgi:4-carboxymuconolactone decarboxylase